MSDARASYADVVAEYELMRAENERLRKSLDEDEQDYVVTSRQLREDNERLRGLLWHSVYEDHMTDRADFYPCVICGHNGPGFWQRDTHPCVRLTDQPQESPPPVGRVSGEGVARAEVVPSPYGSGAHQKSASNYHGKMTNIRSRPKGGVLINSVPTTKG